MDNKNSTQAVLPFDFKRKSIDYYARQHWNVTFSRQGKVSVLAKKIMSAVISQIKEMILILKLFINFTLPLS